MPTAHDRDQLHATATRVVEEGGYLLEELNLRKAGRRILVQVVIDSEKRIDLDAVAAVSRQLDRELEESGSMGDDAYTLEVTTRGTDRPLTLERHFRANIGRLIEFTVSAEKEQARIKSVEHGVVSFDDGTSAEIAALGDVFVVLEFNRKDAKPIEFDVEEEAADEEGAEDSE